MTNTSANTTTPANPDLLTGLANYLTARAAGRAARAATAMRTLHPYERRILREAAVMAYVLGYQTGNLDGRSGIGGPGDRNETIPADSDIVGNVIQCCDANADLYPYLADACAGRRRRITRKRMWPSEVAADNATEETL